MSWNSNTNLLCRRGFSRLWLLRNLARLGIRREDLIDVYSKPCRSVLELATPAWTPGLTKTEINKLERVQKSAGAMILSKEYQSYKSALKVSNMETSERRGENISIKFANRALKGKNSNNGCPLIQPANQTLKPEIINQDQNWNLSKLGKQDMQSHPYHTSLSY